MIRFCFACLLLLLTAMPAIAVDYHIGQGQTYATIAAFDWRSLAAGDHVYIHPGTYREMIWLSRSGTEANPIIIEGVPDGEGNLPVIEGDGMVVPPAYDGHLSEYDLGGGQRAQGYGLIFTHWSITEWGADPEWLVIKNLEIKSAFPELYTFTNSNGVVQAYPDSSSGVYVKTGKHIVIEGCIIHDNGNGIDIQGVDETVYDVTIRGNYIYGNGRTDARFDREHNSYTEAVGILIEHNHYGPLRSGSGGSALKDRSVGTVIRYNFIYSGARTLDLVDSENILNSGYDALNDPNWGNDWVYGNVFINDDNAASLTAAQPFHYGFDNLEANTRSGELKFFNNTVYINTPSIYRMRVFDVSTVSETVTLYNNVFSIQGSTEVWMATSSNTASTGTFNWNGGNWITAGYGDLYSDPGTWTENAAILEGSNTGLFNTPASGDMSIPAGSPLMGAGVTLPGEITTNHDVTLEYLAPRTTTARADVDDIGAFRYTGVAPPSCSDGIQNQGETGIDCGGPCSACSSPPGRIKHGGTGRVKQAAGAMGRLMRE